MSDPRGIIHTVMAIREMVDSLMYQLGATEVPAPGASTAPACEHPTNQRISRKSFGQRGDHWTCGVCGYEHDDDGAEAMLDGR